MSTVSDGAKPLLTPDHAAVLAAADAVVDAFSKNDGERYFAAFAKDATFIFHAEKTRLDDRVTYERLWHYWRASGWAVVSCESSERSVQVMPGAAVFTHTVDTRVATADGPEAYRERETIVFRLEGNELTAVHEHLSPAQ